MSEIVAYLEPLLATKLVETIYSLEIKDTILPLRIHNMWSSRMCNERSSMVVGPLYFHYKGVWFIGAIAMRREPFGIISALVVCDDTEVFRIGKMTDYASAHRAAETVFNLKLKDPNALLDEILYGKPIYELTKIEIPLDTHLKGDTLPIQGEPKK